MGHANIDIAALSPAERLALLGEIWDSLAPVEVPVTQAQRAELDRRLDEPDRDREPGIPWEDVLRRIRERRV